MQITLFLNNLAYNITQWKITCLTHYNFSKDLLSSVEKVTDAHNTSVKSHKRAYSFFYTLPEIIYVFRNILIFSHKG